MVVVLTDGEQLYGVIEWYDKDCIKLQPARPTQPADPQALHQVHVQAEPRRRRPNRFGPQQT